MGNLLTLCSQPKHQDGNLGTLTDDWCSSTESFQRGSIRTMTVGKGRRGYTDLILHLGGITTRGDEQSPRHPALFAGSFCSSWGEKPDCKQAGSPKVCMELRFRDNTGATWAQKGIGVQRNSQYLHFQVSTQQRETPLRRQQLELAGKLLSLFPWLQHAWCSSIHVWTPYLQKVPVKLAAVLQPSAETSTGEGCEQAGEKTDEFGKLSPHGKVIKQQSDGCLKQANGYSWAKLREQS